MQRPRTGARRAFIFARRAHLRGCKVRLVNMDAVAAQVIDVGEAVVGREGCKMRMRGSLPILVRSVIGVGLGPHSLAQFAIGDLETGRAAAYVIGGEQHHAGVVDGHMAGSHARRVLCRQRM